MFADEDMDELEAELKSLLDESKPDSISGLPDVPTDGLWRPGGTKPLGAVDCSADQLEEELSRLNLADSGLISLELFHPLREGDILFARTRRSRPLSGPSFWRFRSVLSV